MRKEQKDRIKFLVSSLALNLIFFVNLKSFTEPDPDFYWFSEISHFWGGFFMAIWLSVFFKSPRIIFWGLVMVTLSWEIMEYFIAGNYWIADWRDTIFDVFLNFSGLMVFMLLSRILRYSKDY